jgi:2-dehydro-3-deoxyphosphogluconate aldolase/(4S)-4-hydroxy-2-oxoglutarate aldolase
VELTEALAAVPAVAILRARSADRLADVAGVLADGGLRAVEVTLTTPGALRALASLERRDGVSLGAGSVLTPDDVRAAVDAGAEFLVAPVTDPEALRVARELGVPMLPGAFTPTEIETAWRAGAAMVKLFPAALGPGYVRAVREPLPHVPLVPTGGVAVDDAPAYLAAGATAVGLGGPLLGDVFGTGDLDALHQRARRLCALLAGRPAGVA